jgi:hypothetical protein
MIELVMVATLGALASALLFLALIPFVNRRAARLALRRLEWRLPLTAAEIAAERDRLRGEIAVKERQAEQRVIAAEEKSLADQTEVGRRLIDLHARSEDIRLLNDTLADRNQNILRLTDTIENNDRAINGLSADLAASATRESDLSSSVRALEAAIATKTQHLAEQKLEIETLEITRQSQLLRISDAEDLNRRLQMQLSEKTDLARALDRDVRDRDSSLAIMTSARQNAEKLAADRADALRATEAKLAGIVADRDRTAQELARETKTRLGLEDEIERRATRQSQLEGEIVNMRRTNAQSATELAMRTGELSSERQARKTSEQSLRELQRKVEATEKRALATSETQQRSENSRVVALEKQLKAALTREADLQKSLDQTRREAQETARDLSGTIAKLRQPKATPAAPLVVSDIGQNVAKLPIKPVAARVVAPPVASNDVTAQAADDPRTGIADMRERMRRKLTEEQLAPDNRRDQRHEPELRALPPGE